MGSGEGLRRQEGFLDGAVAGIAGDASLLAGQRFLLAVEGGRLHWIDLDPPAASAQLQHLV